MKNSLKILETEILISVSNFEIPNPKITLSMVNLRPKMEKKMLFS